MTRSVAVIGGGISGLSAAHRLHELAPEFRVILFESRSRLGGVLRTTRQDGFLTEAAADGFLTSPPAVIELCRRVGLGGSLLTTQSAHRRALVVHDGELEPIPAGFLVMAPSRLGPLLTTPILSRRGKLRAMLEYFVPKRAGNEDESLQSFVCRRFGREIFERLAQPLVGGIYAADANSLSVEATMPRFRKMEQEHGSLIRAFLRNRRTADVGTGARYAQFSTLTRGMSALIEALEMRLPRDDLQVDSPIDALIPLANDRWLVNVGGSRPRTLAVDGVVLAVPAFEAARLLGPVDPEAAAELQEIEYASCAVVSLGYQRHQIQHPLDGFGFVVPLVERRWILSCSFSSLKYSARAPEGSVLLRIFVGGACQSGLLRLPNDQLIELARREVAKFLRIQGPPVMSHLARQPRAMPQYHVGHCDRIAKISRRLENFPTLMTAGNTFHGVGIPNCVQSGEDAASRLAARLSRLPAAYLRPVHA